MKKLLPLSITAITVFISVIVFATHVSAGDFPFIGYLDSYSAGGDCTNAALETPTLSNGASYLVTVKGTMSAWYKNNWINNTPNCGTPELQPIYLSPGIDNGKVGLDPAYFFAGPSNAGICKGSYVLPWGYSLIIFDDFSPRPLIDEYNEVTHSYQYLIEGAGYVVYIYINDSYQCHDNYGRFMVTVEQIDVGGFATGGGHIYDISGNEATFGFTVRNKTGDNKGSFEYQDHAGLNLHSNTINSVIFAGNLAIIEGEIEEGLPFKLTVSDYGEPGGGVDSFKLEVEDQVLVENYIEFGNIQVHNK